MQKNKSDVRVVSTNDEKTRLQTELDSLEAQVEQVNSAKTKMSVAMQRANDSLKVKIQSLRGQLKKGTLTQADLVKAQEDIKQLRYFVTKYTADIEELKKQNTTLTAERDTLKTNLNTTTQKAAALETQNKDLNTKVQTASALKVGAISVTAYKVRGSGKEVDVTKASQAKKIKINFTIASNSLATKDTHDIYIRVLDPTGNLVTGPETAAFQADGQDLQFTYKTAIDFKDDGAPFVIDWVSPGNPAFTKGMYTVILYSDNSTMGKVNFTLK